MTLQDVFALPGSATQFPRVPCVYFLVDSQSMVAYVGCTKNLYSRMQTHSIQKTGAWVVCHWLQVRRSGRDGKESLRGIETQMIHAFDPPCNQVKPKKLSDLRYPPRNKQEALMFIPEDIEEIEKDQYPKQVRLSPEVFRTLRLLAIDREMPVQQLASEILTAELKRPVERLR